MTPTEKLRDLFAELVTEYKIECKAKIRRETYRNPRRKENRMDLLERECKAWDRRLDAILEEMTQGETTQGEKTQGWVRVEDGLPEDCKLVLVYLLWHGWFDVAFCRDGVWTLGMHYEDDVEDFVTHWRPLPPKPDLTQRIKYTDKEMAAVRRKVIDSYSDSQDTKDDQ